MEVAILMNTDVSFHLQSLQNDDKEPCIRPAGLNSLQIQIINCHAPNGNKLPLKVILTQINQQNCWKILCKGKGEVISWNDFLTGRSLTSLQSRGFQSLIGTRGRSHGWRKLGMGLAEQSTRPSEKRAFGMNSRFWEASRTCLRHMQGPAFWFQ